MIYENKNEVTYLYKRNINSETIEKFYQNPMKLTGMKSKVAKIYLNPMKYFYLHFLVFMMPFLRKNIKVNSKDIQSPWITAGIKKIV